MTTIRRASALDVSKLLFVGALWGASFIFIALALQSFGPLSIAAGRILLAALVLVAICLVAGYRFPTDLRDWRKMVTIGMLNSALPFFLISWGMQFISSAESALLMASGTFCALILSHFVSTDERINLARGIGVSIGFGGVLVLVITELLQTGLGGLMGQLAVIAAGASYATSSVMSRRISHLSSLPASAGILATASIYMVPAAWWLERPLISDAAPISIIAMTVLGVVATALAYVIRLNIIKTNGAVFMSQVGYLVPLFGVIWSWMFLSESISIQTVAALLIILLGIGVARHGT
jgi:drug/metabolite transporter (DMT)-like permease